MRLNRTMAKNLINEVPQKLRNAARKERQVIIKEQKKNPVQASFMASRGYFPFTRNEELQSKIAEIKSQTARSTESAYTSHRHYTAPAVTTGVRDTKVVEASTIF